MNTGIQKFMHAKGDTIMYTSSIRKSLPFVLAAMAALSPAGAIAATTTDTFNVTATVLGACTVSATDLGFGNYTPTSGTDLDATSTVTVTCTNGTGYSVGLNEGTHGSTVTTRQMLDTVSSDTLNYALFRNLARTDNWGNTPLTDTVDDTGDGTAQDITVYGRVDANQYVSAGSYADVITVTVTYTP
jgi:spore coat protein U-like protein